MRKIDYNGGRAFAAMCDDMVTVSGKRGGSEFRTSCAACVIDGGYESVIDEATGAESRIRKQSVVIPRVGACAWPYPFAPQTGDIVETADGMKSAVKAVEIMAGGDWSLEVREK